MHNDLSGTARKVGLTNLLGANMVQKAQTRGRSKVEMVNTAFAFQFTWG